MEGPAGMWVTMGVGASDEVRVEASLVAGDQGSSRTIHQLERRAADAPAVTPLRTKPSTREVVAHAIRRSVADHLEDAAGVMRGEDPECLHRARVAIRRLRSDLRTFERCLDSSWSRPLRSDLRELGTVLGAVRDADVLILRIEDSADDLSSRQSIESLIATLVADRTDRRQRLLAFMESDQYAELLDRLAMAAMYPAFDRDGLLPVKRLNRLMRKPWRRLEQSVSLLPDDPPDEMLHVVRINSKRARYASEAVAPAVGKSARRFAKRAADLQKVLGSLQDAAIAQAWLAGWSSDCTDPEAAFVAGQLTGLEIARRSAARSAWRAVWEDLNRSKNTAWIE